MWEVASLLSPEAGAAPFLHDSRDIEHDGDTEEHSHDRVHQVSRERRHCQTQEKRQREAQRSDGHQRFRFFPAVLKHRCYRIPRGLSYRWLASPAATRLLKSADFPLGMLSDSQLPP